MKAEKALKHGHNRKRAVTREYRIWIGLKVRCFNERHRDFPHYGGRGITVCDEWRDDFAAFLRDMGPCPSGHTVERRDNHGPYSPDNCRWATRKEQSQNKRNSVTVLVNGAAMSPIEAASATGVSRRTALRRFQRVS